ncbi:Secreted protein acidic and rich in cysteine [Portunus trituberculatus]|uniref:Secreted protein acidic and rich in cysteine n=1 Tax=Portunus trituberculatus TaxID=210409 RepID=A0A5B7E4Y4_PORTR|nr:Secreted protein acidic and rich in cysteine [Portunus trituberculatus]
MRREFIPPCVFGFDCLHFATDFEAVLHFTFSADMPLHALCGARLVKGRGRIGSPFLPPGSDGCLGVYCGAGRMCVVNDNGDGECACNNACDSEEDARRRVCSNYNETWMSDCELYRQRCLCEEEDQSCLNPENKHVHIEYYGECQQIPECVDEELEDFPRRMSEWLFHIMRDMAERHTLSEHYVRLEREAEEDPKKQWSYAVVWKWCELDSHPKDKAVSRHELFPIRAPLYTLENCVATFLDSCDTNDDHAITLREWATCTKLSEDDLEKFENFCEGIREE